MGKYAIFIVSALIFSMLSYSNALRNALFQSEFRNIESFSQLQALNIANSAALVAINDIRNTTGSNFEPATDDTYSYPSATGYADWEDLAGSYNIHVTNQADTLLDIESTGRFEESNYRVNVGLTKGGTSDWLALSVDKAIHSETHMDLGGGDVIGNVSLNQANSEIEGANGANITGSLYNYHEGPVPDDELENYNGSFTTPEGVEEEDYQESYPLDDKIAHTNPTFPEFTVSGVNTYNAGDEILDYTSYTYGIHFDTFTTNGTTIDTGSEGDVTRIYTNTLDLSKDLNLSGDGTVSIYVSESVKLTGGTINPTSEIPDNLIIYYKGTSDINYQANGSFTGTIFAGNNEAGISIGGNIDFTGHIISFGDEVTLDGNPNNASLLFAPNATVTLGGTAGSFEGAIVSDKFINNGKPKIKFNSNFSSIMPNLQQEDNVEWVIVYWK